MCSNGIWCPLRRFPINIRSCCIRGLHRRIFLAVSLFVKDRAGSPVIFLQPFVGFDSLKWCIVITYGFNVFQIGHNSPSIGSKYTPKFPRFNPDYDLRTTGRSPDSFLWSHYGIGLFLAKTSVIAGQHSLNYPPTFLFRYLAATRFRFR